MINTLTLLAFITLIGIFCQWLAWRLKLPAILFLLISGLILGPVANVVNPDNLFGDLLFPFISLSVAVILFEGSLTLKFSELKEIGTVVRNMVTFGALINAAITAFFTHYIVGLNWPLAALFGALMVVTGPTVVVPLLRTVKPNARVSNALRWEGIVIDPLGALFAVVVFEWIISQQSSGASAGWSQVFMAFMSTIAAGFFVGAVSGYLFGLILRHRWLPDFLHNFASLAFVWAVFAISEELRHESGLLSVTVMGIWLANTKSIDTRDILNFKESLTIVLVSTLFIVLAARVDFGALQFLGWGALGVLLSVQLLSRPVKVFFSTMGSVFTFKERILLAWVGPRGIVAAAVTALFALKLENLGFAQSTLLVPLAFAVIMGTVIVQSATARPLARLLKVAEPDSRGFLIVGGNNVARAIAEALQKAKYRVILCDTLWENISAARMNNIPTYYGNVLSDHADRHLDMVGIGGLLALSHHADKNNMAAYKYRHEFGSGNVFTLASLADQAASSESHSISEKHRGLTLFEEDVTFGKLTRLIKAGAQIKHTTLSDEFNFDAWKKHVVNVKSIPLFSVDVKGNIHWFTTEGGSQPKSGWQIYSMVPVKEK